MNTMKKIALLALLLASPAMAEEAPQAQTDPEQIVAQCNINIGTALTKQGNVELQNVALKRYLADNDKATKSALDKAADLTKQVAALKAQVADMRKPMEQRNLQKLPGKIKP